MTLPVEPVRLARAPLDLPEYSWRGVCRVLDCGRPATDPHHIVPRSQTGGPRPWVLVDGAPQMNVAGLCRFHHDRITFGPSRITYRDGRWRYVSDRRDVPLLPLAAHDAARGRNRCPHCGQKMPAPDPYPRRPARRRVDYTLPVPADEEDGAQILETLTDELAGELGYSSSPAARYYALVAALVETLNGGSRVE